MSYWALPRVLVGVLLTTQVRPLTWPSWRRFLSLTLKSPSRIVSSSCRLIPLHGEEHVVHHVQLAIDLVRVGVDVDERERESELRLLGGQAGPEPADERLAVQEIVLVVERVELIAIDLDAGHVEDEGVLLLARAAAEARAEHVVVMMLAAGVELADELRHDVLADGPDLLNGNDIEVSQDLRR